MSLFRRSNPVSPDTNQTNADTFEEIELPTASDINEPDFSAKDPQTSFTAPVKTHSSGYGIEDAILLMKSLPRDNPEVVVTVVKKTLESTKIQVQDILNDAKDKEERIRSKHKALEAEIKQLQEQISKRNQQISDLVQDLNETTDVRQQLELALELDESKTSKTSSSNSTTSNSVASTTGSQSAVQSGNTGSNKAVTTPTSPPKPSLGTSPNRAASGSIKK
ncbi:MAG: hypothetical protein K6L75_01425 [Cellvibrionaceae bacterium]